MKGFRVYFYTLWLAPGGKPLSTEQQQQVKKRRYIDLGAKTTSPGRTRLHSIRLHFQLVGLQSKWFILLFCTLVTCARWSSRLKLHSTQVQKRICKGREDLCVCLCTFRTLERALCGDLASRLTSRQAQRLKHSSEREVAKSRSLNSAAHDQNKSLLFTISRI